MSLMKILNIPDEAMNKPSPRQQLLQQLESLLTVCHRNKLLEMGFPDEPFDQWRLRDLALAVYLLENLTDKERVELRLHCDPTQEDDPEERELVLEVIRDAIAEEQYLKEVLHKFKLGTA